jgi:UDP-N-acetylmuramate--alanine ligase
VIPIGAIHRRPKIHFIGIGGIGMSGLAEYYLKKGYEVSGSDIVPTDITQRLSELGAQVFKRHSAKNLDSSVEMIVYTSAVEANNPELKQAKKLKIKSLKRSELLAQIVNDKFLIAVSGTHGKTTTTAMVGKLLVDAGFDPLVFVGGNVPEFNGAASRYGTGNYAVVEADEYDKSFLKLKPDIAVITNIDEDHLDIYKNIRDIIKNFKMFCENTKQNSRIVYCGDDRNLSSMVSSVRREKYSYGFGQDCFYRLNDYRVFDSNMNFSILNSHNAYKNISLRVIGKHNALNSAACFAVSKLLSVDFDKFRSIIADFKTVNRRLQLKYDKNNISVYDDYAHHPNEIASSLSALRDAAPGSKIVIIFQPHLYSRTKDFYKQFAKELSAADRVILMDIYPAREKPLKNVSSKLILKELIKKNNNSLYLKDKNKIIKYLLDNLKAGDVVVFQGAGDVTDLCTEFVQKIKLLYN